MSNWLQKQWVAPSVWHIFLIPLSWIFSLLSNLRKALYAAGWLKSDALPVPVVVVGNISVGGTGKTPLVIWLAEQLKIAGYQPGIISRGYGGSARQTTEVRENSDPQQVGDEPVLIVRRTHCPMFVNANRLLAGKALLKSYPKCDVILSDDGLQHYRLQRDVEIAVVNSGLVYGNKLWLLPAGPFREKAARLKSVDAIVENYMPSAFGLNLKGTLPPVFSMQLHGEIFESLEASQVKKPASDFLGKPLVAIAGIGNPDRFFNQLSRLGLQFDCKVFADHHAFTAKDLTEFLGKTILMTEKDAVKCQSFTTKDAWFLPVTATLINSDSSTLITLLLNKLKTTVN
ncbi:MAG: tetraacyldisaccharide 4'-kinase [Methylotenera sp.]|nr:tetraacyldisaccharide 4'-kinase [Methylotenera sp.]